MEDAAYDETDCGEVTSPEERPLARHRSRKRPPARHRELEAVRRIRAHSLTIVKLATAAWEADNRHPPTADDSGTEG